MSDHVFFAQDADGVLRRWHPPSVPPLEPTPEMIDAGAQRLVRFEDGTKWPDDFDKLQVAAARNEAERVWRSMWCEHADRKEPKS